MFTILLKKILILLSTLAVLGYTQSEIGKLPFCSENTVPGLVLVSTIDGIFSAVDSEGTLKWQIESAGNDPLLTSNIHNLELTNNGRWVRIIPSLTGSLYRFDGLTIDPIPITAESLLKSSFKYSDDLVIAGGIEVTTYGVGFRTGKIFYTCSSQKCINQTSNDNELDDVLLLERSSQTVRAIESQSGHERWNFSVGTHNVKLPQVTCIDPNSHLLNWNITAIIPDGLLISSKFENNVQKIWQYHFNSPIVKVWKWNGYELAEVDLFAIKNDKHPVEMSIFPAIYLGMHKKQLYIHESYALQRKTQNGAAVADTASIAKIPWKPISASGLITEDDSTALSILYSSEYVNGHGYYLYSANDVKKKNSGLCKNNITVKFPSIIKESMPLTLDLLSLWWKEVLVFLFTTSLVFNFMFRSFTARQQNKQEVIFVERHVEVPSQSPSSSDRTSESSDTTFSSRYMNDFDTLRCLGKGGFGVVFEVKQKIDECHYAIKRITLPNEESKRSAVMREVKALAKLEHRNIVRYFNSWVEKPPFGWQQQHDADFVSETNEFSESYTSRSQTLSHGGCSDSVLSSTQNASEADDSFIVFRNEESQQSGIDDNSNKTDVVSCEGSPTSGGVNWRRPSRRYHSLNPSVENPPVYLYIQMQLCHELSLREWLVKNSTRNSDNALNIFKQIVSAVEYVHMQGLIHRDLKPSNIFFALDGQIKVGDFGLVKYVDDSYDSPSSISPQRRHTREVGTRLYMSPEQLDGKIYNYKVDIYSLGLIFFELLVYFFTDMERIRTLTDLRRNRFPSDFIVEHAQEYNLLKLMLCQKPANRLTTFGIRARPPINLVDGNYDRSLDFELPKVKTAGAGHTSFKG